MRDCSLLNLPVLSATGSLRKLNYGALDGRFKNFKGATAWLYSGLHSCPCERLCAVCLIMLTPSNATKPSRTERRSGLGTKASEGNTHSENSRFIFSADPCFSRSSASALGLRKAESASSFPSSSGRYATKFLRGSPLPSDLNW